MKNQERDSYRKTMPLLIVMLSIVLVWSVIIICQNLPSVINYYLKN